MNTGCFYEIQIEGVLPERWSAWFEGLAIRPEPEGCTTLCGPLADQAALLGVLNKIHALNLVLVSVARRRSSHSGSPGSILPAETPPASDLPG